MGYLIIDNQQHPLLTATGTVSAANNTQLTYTIDAERRQLRVQTPLRVDPEASAEKDVLERKTVTDYYLLLPGETIIAQTKERVSLAPNLCAWLEGRGRFGRLGLDIRIAAGFVHPGVDAQVFFNIRNHSPAALELYPGTKTCLLIVQQTLGEAKYAARFTSK